MNAPRFNETKQRIANFSRANPKATPAEIAERLGVSVSTVHKNLNALDASGIISRVTVATPIHAMVQITVNCRQIKQAGHYKNARELIHYLQFGLLAGASSWNISFQKHIQIEKVFMVLGGGPVDVICLVSSTDALKVVEFVATLRLMPGIEGTHTSVICGPEEDALSNETQKRIITESSG